MYTSSRLIYFLWLKKQAFHGCISKPQMKHLDLVNWQSQHCVLPLRVWTKEVVTIKRGTKHREKQRHLVVFMKDACQTRSLSLGLVKNSF